MKENALHEVVVEKNPSKRHILRHELIEIRGLGRIENYPYLVTRIGAYAQESHNLMVFF